MRGDEGQEEWVEEWVGVLVVEQEEGKVTEGQT